MISVRNIVKVDLDIITSDHVLGDFETVVYIAPVTLIDEESNPTSKVLIKDAKLVDTLVSGNPAVNISIKNYFANGGSRILVINPSAFTLDAFKGDIAGARTLADDFIYVAISNQLVNSTGYTDAVLSQIADYCDTTASPEKIRLMLTTNSKTFINDKGLQENLCVVKYCTKVGGENAQIIDAVLLVGAYFSKVNLDGTDTVRDYAYTSEKLYYVSDTENPSAEDLSQEDYDNLITNDDEQGYYNVISKVGNSVVNLGGNLATIENISIHTDFGAIAVERDITYAVLERMLGKQYLTEQGISNVKASINAKLQRYKNNGYLNTEATYSGEDLTITYNNVKYEVIKHGTSLPQGFYIFSVPMNNITVADKQERKFTPIYVILETQNGARVVEITGEVR